MGDDKPRVSIGMPVFNGEKYLKEALDSILAQTYSDFELIISDNGSTDRTQEICRAYAAQDRRIRYYRNEKNVGAAKNFNRVFELSSGEYFKWAAHDDVCAQEYVKRCVKVLEQMPSVVLCYPKTTIIDEDGKHIEKYFDGFNLRSPRPHERFRAFFQGGGKANAVFGVIRASALSRMTGLMGNYISSDRVLLAELALLGEFYEVPEYLFFRRDHPQASRRANKTSSERAAWFDPANRRKIQLQTWRRFFALLIRVRRVRMSWHERAACYIQIGKWFRRKLRSLREELIIVSKQILR